MRELPDVLDELQGQGKRDNHDADALQDVEGGGHKRSDNHASGAPSLLNLYVTWFEDAQSERLVMVNQVRCYMRDSTPKEQWPDKDYSDKYILGDGMVDTDMMFILHQIVLPKEKFTRKKMEREVKKHPLWPWLSEIRGMGPTLAGRLLHRVASRHFPSPAHLWSYCGLDGPGWRKNPHNWALTSICFNIAESFQKQPALSGGYRDIYDKRKEYESTKPWCGKCRPKNESTDAPRENCIPAHVNNKARRYAVKMFLKDLWLEMQGQKNSDNQSNTALH